MGDAVGACSGSGCPRRGRTRARHPAGSSASMAMPRRSTTMSIERTCPPRRSRSRRYSSRNGPPSPPLARTVAAQVPGFTHLVEVDGPHRGLAAARTHREPSGSGSAPTCPFETRSSIVATSTDRTRDLAPGARPQLVEHRARTAPSVAPARASRSYSRARRTARTCRARVVIAIAGFEREHGRASRASATQLDRRESSGSVRPRRSLAPIDDALRFDALMLLSIERPHPCSVTQPCLAASSRASSMLPVPAAVARCSRSTWSSCNCAPAHSALNVFTAEPLGGRRRRSLPRDVSDATGSVLSPRSGRVGPCPTKRLGRRDPTDVRSPSGHAQSPVPVLARCAISCSDTEEDVDAAASVAVADRRVHRSDRPGGRKLGQRCRRRRVGAELRRASRSYELRRDRARSAQQDRVDLRRRRRSRLRASKRSAV